MLKKRFLLSILFVFLKGFGQAQNPKQSIKDNLYYDLSGQLYSGILYESVPPGIPGLDSTSKMIELGKVIRINTYYANGKLKSEEHLSQGVKIQYYENGKIWILTDMKNGFQDGKETCWYMSGGIQSTCFFFNNKRNGLYESYYESGEIASRINFVDDKIEGDEKHWFINGQLSSERLNIGIPKRRQEIREYYENGAILTQWIIDDQEKKNYSILFYTSTGKLKKVQIYKEGALLSEKEY